MKNKIGKNTPFAARRLTASGNLSGIVRSCCKVSLTAMTMIAMLGVSQMAKADDYNFSVQGANIDASGILTVSNTGPLGASTVTGINGTFSDSKNNISGAITGLTGLQPVPAPVFNMSPPAAPNTFGPPAGTSAGFSYDDLFWPGADSPAVCTDALAFFGGYFDVYGLAFDVAGGYTADLWSNGNLGGYQLNDSLNGTPFTPNEQDGLAYAVDVNASPTPEPSSLLLIGTGLTSIGALWRRRKTAV
jgi:hypothetical protein